jgi:hypothetical protein
VAVSAGMQITDLTFADHACLAVGEAAPNVSMAAVDER